MTSIKHNKNAAPLIIEEHPTDYDGYPFITLIQQHTSHVLTIVDNVDDKKLRAFVLDLCGPENVDEERIILVAAEWYENARSQYPISFEFSKRNMSQEVSSLLRTFNIDFVTRVIGPMPKFALSSTASIKRRRRKPIPEGVEIKRRQIVQLNDLLGTGFTDKAS